MSSDTFFLTEPLLLILIVLAANYPFHTVVANPYSKALDTVLDDSRDCQVLREATTSNPMIIRCSDRPSDDTYADNLFPSKAFGDLGVLIVQNVPSVPVSKTYAFLKFDLSNSLPDALEQSGAKPINATLRMYVRLLNFFYNATVDVHNVPAGNWSEDTLTWNNMPQFDANNYARTQVRENGTWVRWNVTNQLLPIFNSTGQIAFTAVAAETAWRNLVWFDSKEYPFLNGTTSPTLELIFVEPYLTVETPYPNIPVLVGNRAILTNEKGSVQLMLPWDKYAVSVPAAIPLKNGTRASFVGWNDLINDSTRSVSLGNNVTLIANYGIQYSMNVYSPYATTTGGGWYFENADATIAVNPTSVPLQGLWGFVGGRYVFDHWTGACTTASPQCTVLMDNPKTAVAVWRVDWTLTVIGSVALSFVAAAGSWIKWRKLMPRTRRKHRHRRHRLQRQSP